MAYLLIQDEIAMDFIGAEYPVLLAAELEEAAQLRFGEAGADRIVWIAEEKRTAGFFRCEGLEIHGPSSVLANERNIVEGHPCVGLGGKKRRVDGGRGDD